MEFSLSIDKKVRLPILYLESKKKVSHMSNIINVPLSTLPDWAAATARDEDYGEITSGRGVK